MAKKEKSPNGTTGKKKVRIDEEKQKEVQKPCGFYTPSQIQTLINTGVYLSNMCPYQ